MRTRSLGRTPSRFTPRLARGAGCAGPGCRIPGAPEPPAAAPSWGGGRVRGGGGGSLAMTPPPRPRHFSKHFPGAAQGRTGLRGPRRTVGAHRGARTEGSSPDTLGLLAAHPQGARCPAHLGTDLVPALARLDVHNLSHGGRRLCALGTCSSDRGGDCGPAARSPRLDPLPALHPRSWQPDQWPRASPTPAAPPPPPLPPRLQSPHPQASPSRAAPPRVLAGLGLPSLLPVSAPRPPGLPPPAPRCRRPTSARLPLGHLPGAASTRCGPRRENRKGN